MHLLTYSRNVFLPVTDLCRNRCGYCSFRRDPPQARVIRKSEALTLLARGAEAGCSEALFSLGESPWRVAGFERLMAEVGRSNLLDYLVELCELALEAGLLPHTNAGILDDDGLRRLQPYNASMGMMLETTARLRSHDGSPGKRPDVRLDHIARAGRLQIPFTTGILIGIGESWADRKESLEAIADLHRTYDHIQEVIIQPLDPKPGTALARAPRPGIEDLRQVVRMARDILPPEVAVQVPPNLVDPLPLADAGADDLGGISPVTSDWINPDHPWPGPEELRMHLKGYILKERLPVYPRFILRRWHGQKTRHLLTALASEDGLRRKSISPKIERCLIREEDLA
jgi:FO synthase subunit 1